MYVYPSDGSKNVNSKNRSIMWTNPMNQMQMQEGFPYLFKTLNTELQENLKSH